MVDKTAPVDGAPSLTLDNDELARDYERINAEHQFVSGQYLVEALAIATGERVLDVGCGTGLLTQHIADRVGPAGQVLGIDPLPLRIELAQAKTRANLAFRVGDAYALDELPDGGFDVVCLNAVFHWLPEKTGPLRQFARVLRPGGRLGISTSLKDQRSPFEDAVAGVLSRPPFVDLVRTRAGVTFRVDAQDMRGLLEQAGFSIAQIEVRRAVHHYASADAAIRFIQASSFGNFLGQLSEEQRPAARAAIQQALEAIATPAGIPRDASRVVAIATRP